MKKSTIGWVVIGFIAYVLINTGNPVIAETLVGTWLTHTLLEKLIKKW